MGIPIRNRNTELAVDVDAYLSGDDGHWVIHVDTPGVKDNERGPVCRIYLNDDLDDPIWHNTDGEDSGKDKQTSPPEVLETTVG